MRIAVIGAGFNGVVISSALLKQGHEIVVYEKDTQVGGVWSKSRRYPGLVSNTGMMNYELSDFKRPKGHLEWPEGEENQLYLEAYVNEINLMKEIVFNSELTKADQTVNRDWHLQITSGGENRIEKFDFLIVASGKFTVPVLPDIAGLDEFTKAGGKFLHSSQLEMDEDFADKSVVVLGAGLSGVDLCKYLIENDVQATIISRGRKADLSASIVRKIRNLNSSKFNLLFETKIAKLKPGAIELENGQEVRLDYLIAATGFTHDFSFFDQGVRESILDANGEVVLFRNILPIGIQNLAILGFSSHLFSKFNAELASKWLTAHIDNNFELPSFEEQRVQTQSNRELNEKSRKDLDALEFLAEDSLEGIKFYGADLQEKSQQLPKSPSNSFIDVLSKFVKRERRKAPD